MTFLRDPPFGLSKTGEKRRGIEETKAADRERGKSNKGERRRGGGERRREKSEEKEKKGEAETDEEIEVRKRG